jgi:hypothetical protein
MVSIDDEPVFEREISIIDSSKSMIKAAILSAIEECQKTCVYEISDAIDNYDED